MSAATALRIGHPAVVPTRRIATLFMIGSACFAIASVPGYASISEEASAITYFVGSLFFTAAAFHQLQTSIAGIDRWSSLIQFAGTLFFNVNTFVAVDEKLSPHAKDLLVWAPDAIGSVCFLVSSVLATYAVWSRRNDMHVRRIADFNLYGSIAFGASAVAARYVGDTDELVNAALASSGTLVGAIFFFFAAWMLRRGEAQPVASS
jgi:YrhK-like protein